MFSDQFSREPFICGVKVFLSYFHKVLKDLCRHGNNNNHLTSWGDEMVPCLIPVFHHLILFFLFCFFTRNTSAVYTCLETLVQWAANTEVGQRKTDYVSCVRPILCYCTQAPYSLWWLKTVTVLWNTLKRNWNAIPGVQLSTNWNGCLILMCSNLLTSS